MTAPVELVRELLYYRDMRIANHRDWGMITAFVAGGSLAFPVLAPFAIGSVLAYGVHLLRARARRRGIVGVQLPAAVAAPGARTLYGTARKFRGTVPSILDDTPVLVEHAVVKDRTGSIIVRRSEAAPFLLDTPDDGPVLVTGVARVTPSALAQRARVRRGDPRLGRMGVPEDLGISGNLEVASICVDAQQLVVTGLVEEEAVAELAFHRDGGRIPVMRGRIGAPVLVSDRRLLAAAL